MADDKQSDPPDNTERVPTHDLSSAQEHRPTLLAKPRFKVRNATCIDIDPDDGTETHFIGSNKADCPKCPGDKHRSHDFYLEASMAGRDVDGRPDITCPSGVILAKVLKVCGDCELETEVEHNVKVGQVDAPSPAVQNRAARRAEAAHARRARKG